MNTRVYRQYDSRWGSLPYPTSYSTVSSDGCGLLAVTHCAIELSKYTSSTPKDFYSFMKQYAVAGNGTLWDGIDAGLNYFIGNCKRHDNMSSFFEEVRKGNRVGVILFRSGTAKDGTVWTTSGHYVAFSDYSYKDGKGWLYMKDSGGRGNTGWFTYQDSMAGRIQLLWTAELPKHGWHKEKGLWYYYKNGKRIKNGWAQDSNDLWYWLGSDGSMVTSKWIKWHNDWYYLKADGSMVANGWVKWHGDWYWLKSNGAMAHSEWVKYKNDWYYLQADGAMATGTLKIKGKTYKFDKSGKWIK